MIKEKLRYQYILFDFDGTIVNSNKAVIYALDQAAISHRGTPFKPEELESVLGKTLEEQMRFISLDQFQELMPIYRESYKNVRDAYTTLFDGCKEMLAQLKQLGCQIGVVSNKGSNGIRHGLELFGLIELVDVSISFNDVVQAKPHQEGVFKALQIMGVLDSERELTMRKVLFVGDSGHDLETAQNAGCDSVLVAWTLLDKERLMLKNPTYVIDAPMDLIDIVIESEIK
ncbi:MAG: hypothetical protein BGO41_03400 [Clostridiales bacterium 38-18]|nr:MAG: hypothetical protein BGO41_03400 [Clostridiales bacterium 38-18]